MCQDNLTTTITALPWIGQSTILNLYYDTMLPDFKQKTKTLESLEDQFLSNYIDV